MIYAYLSIWAIYSYFVTGMVLSAISFETPKCPFDIPTSSDLTKFPMIMDGTNSTCEVLTNRGSPYIEIVWTFPLHPSSVNHFRVTISGSRPCNGRYITWFVHGVSCNNGVTECSSWEELLTNEKRVCHVTCRQNCVGVIGNLHVRVHLKNAMNHSLALCYYVLATDYKTVNPWLRII